MNEVISQIDWVWQRIEGLVEEIEALKDWRDVGQYPRNLETYSYARSPEEWQENFNKWNSGI